MQNLTEEELKQFVYLADKMEGKKSKYEYNEGRFEKKKEKSVLKTISKIILCILAVPILFINFALIFSFIGIFFPKKNGEMMQTVTQQQTDQPVTDSQIEQQQQESENNSDVNENESVTEEPQNEIDKIKQAVLDNLYKTDREKVREVSVIALYDGGYSVQIVYNQLEDTSSDEAVYKAIQWFAAKPLVALRNQGYDIRRFMLTGYSNLIDQNDNKTNEVTLVYKLFDDDFDGINWSQSNESLAKNDLALKATTIRVFRNGRLQNL